LTRSFRIYVNSFAIARNLPQNDEEGRRKAKQQIHEISEEVRRCVLDDLVVRRTRTDIRNLYKGDSELLKFPQVKRATQA